MTRRLRAALAALLITVALPAFAGPDDAFDAAAPGALSPRQKNLVLALEGGRYSLDGGFLRDERSAGAALTNAQVAALLATTPLSSAIPGAAPAAGAPAEAAAGRRDFGIKAPQIDFDGATLRLPELRAPAFTPPPMPEARLPALPPANDRLLRMELLQRLVFTGTPQEKAALLKTVDTVLETSMGRALARQFVSERMDSEVRLAPIEGSAIVSKDGSPVLQGTGGQTETSKIPPRVTLNRLYLDVEPDIARVTMAGTLAHELFGHAFEAQRAKNSGTPRSVQYYYRGDETGSRLIDWTVETELVGMVYDDNPDSFLGDAEGFYRSLIPLSAYYATTLSPEEMRDPLGTLRTRRPVIDAARAKLRADLKTMKDWGPIRDHFVSVHGVKRERFGPADKSLSEFESYGASRLETLDAIEARLDSLIAHWSSAAGAKELAELKAGADSSFIQAAESRLEARKRGLLALREETHARAASGSGSVLRLPGMTITVNAGGEAFLELRDLSDMYRDDFAAHPEHWKK